LFLYRVYFFAINLFNNFLFFQREKEAKKARASLRAFRSYFSKFDNIFIAMYNSFYVLYFEGVLLSNFKIFFVVDKIKDFIS